MPTTLFLAFSFLFSSPVGCRAGTAEDSAVAAGRGAARLLPTTATWRSLPVARGAPRGGRCSRRSAAAAVAGAARPTRPTWGLHVLPHVADGVLCLEALYTAGGVRSGERRGRRDAAPDGGCCVAHGAAATCACTTAFSALTGDLRHRFRVAHDRHVSSFTPEALAFDNRCKVFASCKGRFNEYGIRPFHAHQLPVGVQPGGAGETKNMSRQEHHQHGRWQARIGRVSGNKDL
uniref:At2g24240-like C-terminal beta-propeller domain-containing protein n=1 Tax=Oryza glumipatula TaxID=40148 RepID=A0A0D9ZFY2_9ORYZ